MITKYQFLPFISKNIQRIIWDLSDPHLAMSITEDREKYHRKGINQEMASGENNVSSFSTGHSDPN